MGDAAQHAGAGSLAAQLTFRHPPLGTGLPERFCLAPRSAGAEHCRCVE